MIEPTPNHRYHPTPIRVGDELPTWCSKCMVLTQHLWDGHKLICLVCHPEKKPEKNDG